MLSNNILKSSKIVYAKYAFEVDGKINTFDTLRAIFENNIEKEKQICKLLYKKLPNVK